MVIGIRSFSEKNQGNEYHAGLMLQKNNGKEDRAFFDGESIFQG